MPKNCVIGVKVIVEVFAFAAKVSENIVLKRSNAASEEFVHGII